MELTRENLQGSMVALVTPLRKGRIDQKAMKRLLEFHIRNGTDVIVPCGTTGEASTMSHEEHRGVMSFVMEHVDGRVPVICGAGSNATEEAVSLLRHAKKIRANGVLVVTPYYNRPTQEGLYRHYEFLAGKVDIPIVVYNVPARTGVSIAPETVARLARIPNIIGIKEASGSLEQASRIISLCDVTVISGEDGLTLPLLSVGARGVISVTANVAPRQVHDLVAAYLSGDAERARRIHYELLGLSKVLFIETNPIPVKTALHLMGMISGEFRPAKTGSSRSGERAGTPEFRLPLCAMGPDNQKKLAHELKKLKLL